MNFNFPYYFQKILTQVTVIFKKLCCCKNDFVISLQTE